VLASLSFIVVLGVKMPRVPDCGSLDWSTRTGILFMDSPEKDNRKTTVKNEKPYIRLLLQSSRDKKQLDSLYPNH
jgi:hypothetical protein